MSLCRKTTREGRRTLQPFQGSDEPQPEPIPPSYGARGPRWGPGRVIRGLASLSRIQLAALALGGILGAVWAVQLPWHPALGLLGLLVITTAVLATGAWGLRRRVPLLGSPSRRSAVVGWALLGGLLVVAGLASRPAP